MTGLWAACFVVEMLGAKGIVVVKASVFGPVREARGRRGLGEMILNKEALPFPSHDTREFSDGD